MPHDRTEPHLDESAAPDAKPACTALVPFAVGAYITAAYWFSASTSFANPAVAIARSLTNTFSGIRPVDLPGFILAELCGAFVGMLLMNWMLGRPEARGPVRIAETSR